MNEDRKDRSASYLLPRTILPSVLAVLAFTVAAFLYIIPSFERNMMERKRETLRELNRSVHSLLSAIRQEEVSVGRERAQARAIRVLRRLRYGPEGKDYFWITDLTPRMLMHPYRTELEGKDLSDFRDSHGKRMFSEFAAVAKRDGAGYVDYMWQWKDDPGRVVPKLSHVELFEPWGWVFGTGIYIEDVRQEIARLERRLVQISFLIAAILALVLLYVNHQGIRTERARRRAEALRADSEEKYRKLAEASTEGIVMVLGGEKVYSNGTLLEMLGYSEDVFGGLPLRAMFHSSSEQSLEYITELLEGGESQPQVEASLLRSDGETLRALLTASPLVLGGRHGFILTVKDIDRHKRTEEELAESREKFRLLTDAVNLGVFRLDLVSRRITEANPAASAVFGRAGKGGAAATAEELLAPLERSGALTAVRAGDPAREVPVSLGDPGSSRLILFSLLPVRGEDGAVRWCDGLLEDITERRRTENERDRLLAELQMSLGALNLPVGGIVRKAVFCPVGGTAARAAELMTRSGSSSVLLESGGEPVGIVTDHDLRARLLAAGCSPGEPAARFMSAPLVCLPDTAMVFEAVMLMQERGVRHVAVKDGLGRIVGVIDEKELLSLKWYSPAVLLAEFSRAADLPQLVAVKNRLPRLAKTLSDSGAPPLGITRLISSAADALTSRLVDLAVLELGAPPSAFAFMALGSQARGEQTLLSDQDNAIVYADPRSGGEASASAYFQALGRKVCGGLKEAGYDYCAGGAMASDPRWCRPLSDWKKYFQDWAAVTDERGLLNVNVFFDFRLVRGEASLEEELRCHVRSAVRGRKIFFLNLAENALAFKPPLGFRGAVVADDTGPDVGTFDIKSLMRAVSDFARVYALRGDITSVSTLSRLSALAESNVLDAGERDALSQAFENMMRIRLGHQARRVGAGLPPDNRVNPAALTQAEQLILRDAASSVQMAVEKLGNLIKFRIA